MTTWIKFKKHFKTITKHKAIVFKYACKAGIPWQGITHDMSKFSPCEFWAGVKYYEDGHSPKEVEREALGYSLSWLNHKAKNKHHFEYWVDYNKDTSDKDHILVGTKMPDKYIVEMFCDRIAACKTYLGDKYTSRSPLDYYNSSRSNNLMHAETKSKLCTLLNILAVDGEDAVFDYIKRHKMNK